MKSAIEMCIDAAARLAKTKTDKQAARETVPYAREELTALLAEVAAAHEYQATLYQRIMPIVCLWQLETGNDDRWPDLVVLINWLQARGDKARADYSQILDEREILEAG